MELQAPKIRPDGLQISDDPAFQRVFWRIERLAWVAFLLIICLALLGLTGSGGPLSSSRLRVGSAEVTYDRIMRWQTPGRMTITILEPTSNEFSVVLDSRYSSVFSVDRVVPDPEQVELTEGGHTYRFSGASQSGAQVVFDLTARGPGWARFDLSIGSQTRPVVVWVFP